MPANSHAPEVLQAYQLLRYPPIDFELNNAPHRLVASRHPISKQLTLTVVELDEQMPTEQTYRLYVGQGDRLKDWQLVASKYSRSWRILEALLAQGLVAPIA
jgi:hypothetical protein